MIGAMVVQFHIKMKTKNILFSISMILALILTLTLVSAERPVAYSNIYYGIIEDDAGLTTSTTAISDFDVIGYSCATNNCTTIGAQVPGLTNHTDTSSILVTFPTTQITPYGYVLYFYKDGYIGWEQRNVKVSGTNASITNAPSVIYLSKKRNGFAPIMNLTVQEEVPTNQPIRVGFNVSVDADTYSAIERATQSDMPLNEEVETLVTLEIYNASGQVYTASQTVSIPYSQSVPINFDVPSFANPGRYDLIVGTDVTDEKILNSMEQGAGAFFNVIQANLTNYTYTLIDHLQITPALPRLGDNIVFTFDYLSGYINETGGYNPANTNLTMMVTGYYGGIISIDTASVGSSGTYSFNTTFTVNGSYVVWITGTPNDARGSQSFSDQEAITFVMSPAINYTNHTDDDDDDDDNNEQEVDDNNGKPRVYGDSLPLNEISANTVIDLTQTEEKENFNYKKMVYWIVILVLIMLIAVVLVYILKFI
jgi:hypothetical protein